MASQSPVLKIEAAPGDAPRAIEQLDGDLLVPAGARPVLERALLLAEQALAPSQREELAALAQARLLLGIERVDTARQTMLANLVRVRRI